MSKTKGRVTLPTFILYIFLSEKINVGVISGGVKGWVMSRHRIKSNRRGK